MNKNEKLKKLVEEAKELKNFLWLSQTNHLKIIFSEENRPVPIKNVRYVYSVRGKINEDRGSPVKGFETLLKNLDTTQSENIIIHHMTDDEGYNYLIFANPDLTELIGILKLQKKISED